MDLPLFLDMLFWGHPDCHAHAKFRYARTSLLVSEELPNILDHWHRPPRIQNKGRRPAGARNVLENFTVRVTNSLIDNDMEAIACRFYSKPADLTKEHLTSFNFRAFASLIKSEVPLLWKIFERVVFSDAQGRCNIQKDLTMVILCMISQGQNCRSHRRGMLSKIWALYLKACGLSARAFDALHLLGIVMSHKWAANAYSDLSEHAMEEVSKVIHGSPWVITHDNVNIPMRVFSQRLHNQSHFISGCAATVWVLPEDAKLSPNVNRNFLTYQAQQSKTQFSYSDILYGDPETDTRLETCYIHHILSVLLNSPDFMSYKHRDADILQPPPPVNELPCGPNRVIQQHILKTQDQEEASYDGNDKAILGWFHQLGILSEEQLKKIGLECLIVWIGDQLTAERLRGLQRYRHEDINSYDWMDWMLPTFGWFHLVMAFANSLHKQYLGTSAGIGGLQQAFDVLQCKGLQKPETKGPFWAHLDEALSPTELYELAVKVYTEYVSRRALSKMENMPDSERDHVQMQFTMWNADILSYIELTEAIKFGDVSRMEDLLPTLLFRFAGGGNSKYTIEILELLQGLRQEWPDEVRNFVRKHCWLMNRSVKRDGWTPYDKGQDQNICDIKVTYHSFGPGATWDYLHKVSPAIPTLCELQRHMEKEFGSASRGTRHGIPSKEVDVAHLDLTLHKASQLAELCGSGMLISTIFAFSHSPPIIPPIKVNILLLEST
ncbi:hypothetical protein BU15DRAFT_60190 [Melanogaster broomeanus]|nr:hypothetical protein BU15DRAFT_60190 [Melanogaster broomeanus]